MTNSIAKFHKRPFVQTVFLALLLSLGVIPSAAPLAVPRGPPEPRQGRPQPKNLVRPAGGIARTSVDEKSMRAMIGKLVGCGTRLTLSSWADPKRGIGCGRDAIAARFHEIAKDWNGKYKVAVGQCALRL